MHFRGMKWNDGIMATLRLNNGTMALVVGELTKNSIFQFTILVL